MDSTAGAHVWDTQPMTGDELAVRDEELAWLMRHERRNWRLINGRIAGKGDPVAAEGTYGALLAYPPAQSGTAVTGGTANVAWWSAAVYSPIPANSVLAPQAYRVIATGTVTSSATAQTLTPSANVGTAVGTGLGTGPALSLGASSAQTGMLWYLIGDLTVRTAGSAGTVYGMFEIRITNAAGASSSIIQALYGNTVQSSIDFTAATGVTLGATPSATGVSVTMTQIHFCDWN
jgi:hypothetical protein